MTNIKTGMKTARRTIVRGLALVAIAGALTASAFGLHAAVLTHLGLIAR